MIGQPIGFWDKEEFEDLVAKGLLAMYESEVAEKYKYLHQGLPPERRLSSADLAWIRKIGPYFPPDDRIFMPNQIDIKNDGLPSFGSTAIERSEQEEDVINGYIDISFAKRIQSLPSSIKQIRMGLPYLVYSFYPQHAGGYMAVKDYVTINPVTGQISPTKCKIINHNTGNFEWQIVNIIKKDENIPFNQTAVWAAACLSYWSDRRHLWNVEAIEHTARATFGVYQEQIKSLFYSRSIPLTLTGRKRPILNWVSAHTRRMKEGIEIDIDKYLRGINEFEMNGTIFKITRPIKGK